MNEGNNRSSLFGNLFKAGGSAVKKRFLMALVPAVAYLLLGGIAVLLISMTFNNMFSMITGKDPFLSAETMDEEDDVIYDINDKERIPGYEEANDFMSTYDELDDDPNNNGFKKLKQCSENVSLFRWISRKFSTNFDSACQMINYIHTKGTELTKKYNQNLDVGAQNIELDRGLLISTFYYAYVFRDKADEIAVGEKNEGMELDVSSGDPLTIINHMIEHSDEVKVDQPLIDEMYEKQVFPGSYMNLTWEPAYTIDVGHIIIVGTGDNAHEEFVLDYTETYLGCTITDHGSVQNPVYEFDPDIYKIYLRDKTDEIFGKVTELNTTPRHLTQEGTGYVGAKNYFKTVSGSTGYCLDGEPQLGEHTYLADYSAPSGDKTHIVHVSSPKWTVMSEAQSFLKGITEPQKHQFDGFLKHADYDSLEDDDLSFTWNNQRYEINYEKGFINEKYSYMIGEYSKKFKNKRIEQIIDVIYSNADSMNDALNFPHQGLTDAPMQVTNVAIVIGDEANPLGDFPYVVTSGFGWRPAVYRNGVQISGNRSHLGIDMAGYGIYQKGIYAWKPGTVIRVGYDGSRGNYCMIEHESADGTKVVSGYFHQDRQPIVKVGDHVEAGTLIGYVGSTGASSGPHLHFQIEVNGTPVSPCPYIKVGRTCADAGYNG